MTNKLAKTVMRNISGQNLKNENSRKSRDSRRDIGKRVNIETSRPYSRKIKSRNYREAKASNEIYDRKKTILLSNYSTLGDSQGDRPRTSKPSQKRSKNLSSLAKEMKGQDVRGASGSNVESSKERRNIRKPGKQSMTLGDLSRSKGGRDKETKAYESNRNRPKRSVSGSKKLSLDSLADSMKNNN